ncbi:Na/Pi cotransporter family protein [bacterium]|nr:Na/Pi cotransporter family protein [bacterium]
MFLVLIGSLGMFVYGMKMMSEGLQQSAGEKLRQILSSMTANKYLGVISGFLITALVQSSSATTVMTVSFVNAGLLTLVESAGVMMGANIGTTITGWLVSIFGFKVSISSYSLIFIAFGAPLMFSKRKNFKAWANAIIGFALLFMGLGFLKDAVPPMGADSPIIEFFTRFSDIPFLGRIIFVLLGTLVTIVVQSSSAAMALTLTLVLKGVIPFEVGAAMILGENIGTTITAEIASLVGNVHAKRSARIHSMFNIIGVTWMILLMPVFIKLVTYIMVTWVGIDPYVDDEGATIALAAFHTVFNLTNVLLLIWFVDWLVRVAERTVKSKGEDDEIFKLEYIAAGITKTPELSVLEAKKELVKFAELTQRMQTKLVELINTTDTKRISKLMKKIAKYEEITDNIEKEVTDYLSKVSASELSEKSSNDLRAMLSISNELERVGDIIFQISKIIEKKLDKKVWFDQKQRDQLKLLCDKVDEGFMVMIANLNLDYSSIDLAKARDTEHQINDTRNKIRKRHLKSLEKGEYKAPAGLIYSNMFSSLERIGDHLMNISEAASGINLE